MPDFTLRQWNAWTPTLDCQDSNLDGQNRFAVPKMLQRRLTDLAKIVFNVASPCIRQNQQLPVVFSSAHGEICKSLAMLQAIQAGEELSPTAFSLSVHNAIAGLFSIAYGNSQEITVVAPGQEGIAPAFIEALGMLHEGAEEVLMILYDEPLADFFPTAPYRINIPFPCALALRIALNGEGLAMRYTHSTQAHDDGEHPVQLLAFIQFLLNKEEHRLSLGNLRHSWLWQKK